MTLQYFSVLTSSLVRQKFEPIYFFQMQQILWMKDRLQQEHFCPKETIEEKGTNSGKKKQNKTLSILIIVLIKSVIHEVQICKKI